MTTAYFFAGFDALDSPKDRENLGKHPLIKTHLKLASEVIGDCFSDITLIEKWNEPEGFLSSLPHRLAATVAAQVALYKLVAERAEPNLLMGCSLGDLARSVCAGSTNLEDTIEGAFLFGQVLANRSEGAVYSVCAPRDISSLEIEKILPPGIYLSVHQTPRHFLVSGKPSEIEGWIMRMGNGFRTRIYGAVPIHSPLLNRSGELLKTFMKGKTIRKPEIPIFSSICRTQITDGETMRKEIESNILSTVYWSESFQSVFESFAPDQIINIGPADTLKKFARFIPLHQNFHWVEAFPGGTL